MPAQFIKKEQVWVFKWMIYSCDNTVLKSINLRRALQVKTLKYDLATYFEYKTRILCLIFNSKIFAPYYKKYVLQMNYAKAVKRPKTRTYMANILQSKAEIEFGFELSTVEVSRLLKRFSIDYVFDVTEKVCM